MCVFACADLLGLGPGCEQVRVMFCSCGFSSQQKSSSVPINQMDDGWECPSESVSEAEGAEVAGSSSAPRQVDPPTPHQQARSCPRGRSRSRCSSSQSPPRYDRNRKQALGRTVSAPPPACPGLAWWQAPLWEATMHLRLKLPDATSRPMSWELFCAGAGGEAQIAKAGRQPLAPRR